MNKWCKLHLNLVPFFHFVEGGRNTKTMEYNRVECDFQSTAVEA